MNNTIIVIEDKSIDEAIEKACREFGVPRKKLNIEIISEGSSGFLGVLAKKAKIRASLLDLNVSFDLDQEKPLQDESGLAAQAEILSDADNIKSMAADSSTAPKAKEILTGILSRMSFDCRVNVQETQEKIILNIEGDTSGLLIGKHGQNLDAIQYIISKAVNRPDTQHKMIQVDSEAYRKKREESLLTLAKKIREKVKKTKKPVSLNNMNAHDRRIIHLALKEDEGLYTKSRGEGEYRKIIVLPAKKAGAGNVKSKQQ